MQSRLNEVLFTSTKSGKARAGALTVGLAVSAFPVVVSGQVPVGLVVEEGNAAPGLAGEAFCELGNPSTNASGHIAFLARITTTASCVGTDTDDRTVWVGPAEFSQLELLAREGQDAPGTEPGTVFDQFFGDGVLNIGSRRRPYIAPTGEVLFFARLRDRDGTTSNITAANDFGMWAGTPGNLRLVAREGDPAPGTEADTVFSVFRLPIGFNSSGVVFSATVAGPGVGLNTWGIWSGSGAASLNLVARVGGPAPGFPPIVLDPANPTDPGEFTSLVNSWPNINPAGEVTFISSVQQGLWSASAVYGGLPGNLKVIVYSGQDFADFSFGIFSQGGNGRSPLISASGSVSFQNRLVFDGGVTRQSIWLGGGASLQEFAREGNPPFPGAGFNFSTFFAYPVTAIDRLALRGTFDNAEWYIAANPPAGDFRVLAMTNTVAPGGGLNLTFSAVGNDPVINLYGDVAFNAQVTGDVTARGLWLANYGAVTPAVPATVELVALEGAALTLQPGGQARTPSSGSLGLIDGSFAPWGVGNSDGLPSALSDNGQLVFTFIATETNERGIYATPVKNFDLDGDGTLDELDNCTDSDNGPLVPDAGGNSQRDTDGDGFGNICDPDFNGNGVVDPVDFSLLKSRFGQAGFPDQDLNGNGIVDPFDFSLLKSKFGQAPGPSGLVP